MEAALVYEVAPAVMRLAGLVRQSIVDGPGLRMTVFAQGCPHDCPGCHNPGSHSFHGGQKFGLEDILVQYDRNPLLSGVTLSGGEPFEQAETMSRLARAVRGRGGNVWCYSGYTFEELLDWSRFDRTVAALCGLIDVLVDGRYDRRRRSLSLRFRGSANQRIIDMPRSLAQGVAEIIPFD